MFLQLKCFESLDLIPIDDVKGPIEGPPLNGKVVSRAWTHAWCSSWLLDSCALTMTPLLDLVLHIENLIKPAGWVALTFHFTSLFLHIFVFGTWAKSAVNKAPDDPSDGVDPEASGAPAPAAEPQQQIDDAIAEMKTSNPTADAAGDAYDGQTDET